MRLIEFATNDKKLKAILETGSTGGTIASNMASVPMAGGAVIRRMPSEPNLFGYVPQNKTKSKKKRKKTA